MTPNKPSSAPFVIPIQAYNEISFTTNPLSSALSMELTKGNLPEIGVGLLARCCQKADRFCEVGWERQEITGRISCRPSTGIEIRSGSDGFGASEPQGFGRRLERILELKTAGKLPRGMQKRGNWGLTTGRERLQQPEISGAGRAAVKRIGPRQGKWRSLERSRGKRNDERDTE